MKASRAERAVIQRRAVRARLAKARQRAPHEGRSRLAGGGRVAPQRAIPLAALAELAQRRGAWPKHASARLEHPARRERATRCQRSGRIAHERPYIRLAVGARRHGRAPFEQFISKRLKRIQKCLAMETLSDELRACAAAPEDFLVEASATRQQQLRGALKRVFDLTVATAARDRERSVSRLRGKRDRAAASEAQAGVAIPMPRPALLDELLVEGVDVETIWQELELQNGPVVDWALKAASWLLRHPSLNLTAAGDEPDHDQSVSRAGDEDEMDDDAADDDDDDDDDENELGDDDDDEDDEDEDDEERDEAVDEDGDGELELGVDGEMDDDDDDEDDDQGEDEDDEDDDDDDDDEDDMNYDGFFSLKDMDSFAGEDEEQGDEEADAPTGSAGAIAGDDDDEDDDDDDDEDSLDEDGDDEESAVLRMLNGMPSLKKSSKDVVDRDDDDDYDDSDDDDDGLGGAARYGDYFEPPRLASNGPDAQTTSRGQDGEQPRHKSEPKAPKSEKARRAEKLASQVQAAELSTTWGCARVYITRP